MTGDREVALSSLFAHVVLNAQMPITAQELRAAHRTVIASIGPMTSEEVVRHGLPIDIEPSHPKMGFLIKEMAEQCDALFQAKRCADSAK